MPKLQPGGTDMGRMPKKFQTSFTDGFTASFLMAASRDAGGNQAPKVPGPRESKKGPMVRSHRGCHCEI